mgnify:CR=1 FL=1
MCVFLPIVFTEGITRQLFVDMGLTIAYSLLASLLIALTVVPAMASKMLGRTKEQKEGRKQKDHNGEKPSKEDIIHNGVHHQVNVNPLEEGRESAYEQADMTDILTVDMLKNLLTP